MTNLKATKKALVSSVLALVMCFTMLLGTTFAWFTDSVTSSGNVIQAGKLDVELYKWNDTVDAEHANATAISESSEPIFGKADSTTANANTADTLWEPGKTQTVYLSIKNNGTLDLKYKVALEVTNITNGLNEVLTYVINNDVQYGGLTKADLPADWSNCSKVVSGINIATEDVALEAGAEHFFALSVHMDELAGNEYQNGNITFNIKVLAGQLASEEDSFDNQYDADAIYPDLNYVEIPSNDEFPVAGLDVDVLNENDEKVGSMNFPSAALDDNATHVAGKIVPTDSYAYNIAINAGEEVLYFDITAMGLKSDNDVPVTVRVYLGEDKIYDPNTFKMYHKDQEIDCSYNPNDGYVTFASATFSPFAIVFDADSTYVPSVVPAGLPEANVVASPEYVGVDLEWGSYGQWSPTAGLDNHLEAAYTFSCKETLEEAKLNDYANWYCDFYVVLDKALGANQIFLGGNYGSFGWVGFHNGELELEANTEIGLLESVTTNPWTYADVYNFVNEFTCGVGDVNDALDGATFTVKLRLTNPADSKEFYDVNVVTYTFGGTPVIDGATVVTTAEQLAEAFENADDNTEIQLGGDIDLNDLNNLMNGN